MNEEIRIPQTLIGRFEIRQNDYEPGTEEHAEITEAIKTRVAKRAWLEAEIKRLEEEEQRHEETAKEIKKKAVEAGFKHALPTEAKAHLRQADSKGILKNVLRRWLEEHE